MWTKADDADVNEELWDQRCYIGWEHVEKGIFVWPLNILGGCMLKRCRYNVLKILCRHLHIAYGNDWFVLNSKDKAQTGKRKRQREGKLDKRRAELAHDMKVGRDAVNNYCAATWWEWPKGSTLCFWRWPPKSQRETRDGTPVSPHIPSDKERHRMTTEKLKKVFAWRYILKGPVNSTTGYFDVNKGTDDIRMVYDATKCGLNNAVWAPNLGLPTVDSVARILVNKFWSRDIDVGNFPQFPIGSMSKAICRSNGGAKEQS
eukprot:15334093-Ditylum_brightwellii.AAC.1